ncbi:hypothetical protein SAMN05421858_5054 [Haladaptatus litoreus]|uniref:Pectate lyase superfamily protein n=1 Tax=Haladaptatus litoreus TaxID=553468 RepID=A0A1N7FHA8_9EURY|nr:hypothetical protein [Haladaptatus litoreus]SIR99703.1 hypothetical protein SAMN05421858_5054 [Haladaptatus litoreus]
MATYNVVTDLGADDTGSTAIDSDIEPEVASGNTLVFPPGDYLLNSLSVGSTVSNFTLQGQPGATLIPKDWGGSNPTDPFVFVAGSGFEWHQFEIDVNGRNPGVVDIEGDNWELTRLVTNGQVHCETDGQAPSNSDVARSWFSLWVPTSGAHGLIEDCYFHDGSNQSVSQGSNRRAILIDGGQGDITINRCWFEQWGENTIYAKNIAGHLNIYNSYWKNTQNGARTGGDTTVRNCVSIKDAPHPKNWADSALQRGVGYEADGVDGADYDQYNGTNVVQGCDFYHNYISPIGEPDSCGAPIGGTSAPERASIINCRIYYRSDRSHNAVYNGGSVEGPPEFWRIQNTHIDNDCPGDQYCIFVGDTPNEWGEVSGVWSAQNGRYSNSSYVRSRMTTGNPDNVNTTPPLPEPPSGQPMSNATIVTVDNTGGGESSEYSFEGVGSTSSPDSGTIHPSGVGGRDINIAWGGSSAARRIHTASGTVEPGDTHRYYIHDGALKGSSFSQTGNATLTVDGETASTANPALLLENGEWNPLADGTVHGKAGMGTGAMKYLDSGEWQTAVEKQ